MKYIIVIFFSILLFSCKKKTKCCVVFDATIEIEYRDSLGRNLLAQGETYAYKFNEMKHYYLEGVIKTEINLSNADFPKHMYLYNLQDSIVVLRVSPYFSSFITGVNTYYDYLELSSTDEDTIKCDVYRSDMSTIVKKIWYNDSLVFTEGMQPYKNFIVRK